MPTYLACLAVLSGGEEKDVGVLEVTQLLEVGEGDLGVGKELFDVTRRLIMGGKWFSRGEEMLFEGREGLFDDSVMMLWIT